MGNMVNYHHKIPDLISYIKEIPGKKTVCVEFKDQSKRIIDVSPGGRFGYATFHLWDFEEVLNTSFNKGALITIWKFNKIKREKPNPYIWTTILGWEIPKEVYGILIYDHEINLLPAKILKDFLKIEFVSKKNIEIHPSIYKDFQLS